jgi:hypothetical protein
MGEHGQPIFDDVFAKQDASLGVAPVTAPAQPSGPRMGDCADPRHLLNQVDSSSPPTGQLLEL